MIFNDRLTDMLRTWNIMVAAFREIWDGWDIVVLICEKNIENPTLVGARHLRLGWPHV